MAEFNSETKTIPYNDADVFAVLSDFRHIEAAKDRLPMEKLQDFTFDTDSCTVAVDPVGKVRFVIIERTPNTLIKFQAQQVPFAVTMHFKFESSGQQQTQMTVCIDAELNMLLKSMVSKPLQQALDKMAQTLAALPFSEILNQQDQPQ